MAFFEINGKILDTPDLLSGKQIYEPKSEFEIEVIQFLKNWNRFDEFEVSTSGSTGPPKLIRVKKSSMEQSSRMTATAIGLNAGMTALLAMSPKYIAGKMMLARALTLGLNVIAVEPSMNPLSPLEMGKKIDFTALVPMQLKKCIEEGFTHKLDDMHAILVGGGNVSFALSRSIEALQAPVYHTYGMTETLSHIGLRRMNGPQRSDWFEALPGIHIEQDERGCMTILGGFLEEAIVTNDLVEIEDQNKFRWLGRYDNVINSGGIKLNPEILEPKISAILIDNNLDGKSYFIAGIPDETLGEKAVMFTQKGSDLDNSILDIIKPHLESFECPREVIILEYFLETETGKLRRKPTVEKYLSGKF